MRLPTTLTVSLISASLGLGLFSVVPAQAKTDTLTGLTPGDLIGCDYTFQNGDPSIPCAKDRVGADGKVSFLKPNANFDNIEYFDFTTNKPIVALLTPENTPLNSQITAGTEYPILGPSFGSFFDVFVDIQIEPFNSVGDDVKGTFSPGQTFDFIDGTSSELPGVSIGAFTGVAVVDGFDVVGVPESSTWTLMLLGVAGLGAAARLARSKQDRAACLPRVVTPPGAQ